jgi:hypothetical protein
MPGILFISAIVLLIILLIRNKNKGIVIYDVYTDDDE